MEVKVDTAISSTTVAMDHVPRKATEVVFRGGEDDLNNTGDDEGRRTLSSIGAALAV